MTDSGGLPSVALIITTFNDSYFLPAAVDSVVAGSLLPTELIVVDDGSDGDQVLTTLQKHLSNIAYLRVIRQSNGGPASARSTGIEHAQTDFIAFLDADDILTESSLEHRVSLLASSPDRCAGAYGSFTVANGRSTRQFREGYGTLIHDLVGLPGGYPGGSPAYVFRREVLASVGGFDTELRMNEDFDLILRISAAGYHFIGDNHSAFVRNRRLDSLTRGAEPLKAHERTMDFIQKARDQKLLSETELRRREKASLLVVAKRERAAGSSGRQVRATLTTAFGTSPPEGAREHLAMMYLRLSRACGRG